MVMWCHHLDCFVPLLVPDASQALHTQFHETISNEMQHRWYWDVGEWVTCSFSHMEHSLTHCVSQPSLLHSRTSSGSPPLSHTGIHFWFLLMTLFLCFQTVFVLWWFFSRFASPAVPVYLCFAIRAYSVSIIIKNGFLNKLSVTHKWYVVNILLQSCQHHFTLRTSFVMSRLAEKI